MSLGLQCRPGTLTKNEMTLTSLRTSASLFHVTGVGYDPTMGTYTDDRGGPVPDASWPMIRALLTAGSLCNDSSLSQAVNDRSGRTEWVTTGDPTEVALLTAAMKAGLQVRTYD